MRLAENIRYLRESRKMTQEDLAKAIGDIWPSAVGNWEAGRREPDIETIIKIADYFGVSLDDLILHELKPPIPLYVVNIEYLRKKHGMTQDDMANLLGRRGKQGYNAIKTEKAEASIEDLEKICDFFGVTLDQLVKHDLTKGAVRDGKAE